MDECRCEIDPERDPDGAVVVTDEGRQVRFAIDPRCPSHGKVARVVSRSVLRRSSLTGPDTERPV